MPNVSIPALAPLAEVSEEFLQGLKELSVTMSRSTAPQPSIDFGALVTCFRCDHISNDHRHDDAHECPTNPIVADREMCPFRCTAAGCECADMIWTKAELHYEAFIRELEAQVRMLGDAVVAAYSLWSRASQMPSWEREAASASLRELAKEITEIADAKARGRQGRS